MTDETREPDNGDAEFAPQPSVGNQLKAAREAKQMSVGDIAMALKLGAKQVEALENGNWQSLPGQTFIRGFVRNYARLLQVDPAPLMAQLDAVLDSPQLRLTLPGQKRQVAMPQVGRHRRRDYAIAWIGGILLAVAAGIYFLLPEDLSELRADVESVFAMFSRKDPEPAPAAPAPQSEPVFPPGTTPQQVMNPQAVVPGEAANGSPPAALSSPALVPPPISREPQAKEPQQALPLQEASPAAAGGKTAALKFSFERDSWVEVRDRNGRILFSQLNRAGSEQNVDGQGPFSLVVGNAPGVKLSLRGKPVDLAAHSQGNVARLTLE